MGLTEITPKGNLCLTSLSPLDTVRLRDLLQIGEQTVRVEALAVAPSVVLSHDTLLATEQAHAVLLTEDDCSLQHREGVQVDSLSTVEGHCARLADLDTLGADLLGLLVVRHSRLLASVVDMDKSTP